MYVSTGAITEESVTRDLEYAAGLRKRPPSPGTILAVAAGGLVLWYVLSGGAAKALGRAVRG